MTDTTIAAGEIRERENEHRWEARFYGVVKGPAGIVADGLHATASVFKVSGRRQVDVFDYYLTPAEARDFARAILAAADWAERQGR